MSKCPTELAEQAKIRAGQEGSAPRHEAPSSTIRAWQGVKCSQVADVQENMIDLPEGYPLGWVGLLLLRLLLYAWSFGWPLCPIGLVFSAIFLVVSIGIMG